MRVRPFAVLVCAATVVTAAPAVFAKKYRPPADRPTATIVLETRNASGPQTRIRGTGISAYGVEPDCGWSAKMDNFWMADTTARNGKAVALEAGAPVGLTLSYSDGRQAQNRSCAVSGTFVPEPGSHYRAILDVDVEVKTCTATILREQDGGEATPVALAVRERVCPKTGRDELTSGRGYWLDWHFKVISY